MPRWHRSYHTAGETRLSEFRSNYSFCRPVRASAIISRFAYSSTLPAVIPLARRVISTGNSLKKLLMYSDVPSPSTVGLVAMMTSTKFPVRTRSTRASIVSWSGPIPSRGAIRAEQDVINALEDAGLFQTHQIARLLHDTKPGRFSRVRRHRSRRYRDSDKLKQVAQYRTSWRTRRMESASGQRLLLADPQQVKGQTFGALAADTREDGRVARPIRTRRRPCLLMLFNRRLSEW